MGELEWYEQRSASATESLRPSLAALLEVGRQLFELHREAISLLSENSDPRDKRTSLLKAAAIHAENTYVVAVDCAAKGLSDVGVYLLRGLFDISAVVQVLAIDAELAERFLNYSEYKPSEARISVVDFLQSAEQERLASQIDQQYREEAKVLNQLSHFGMPHVDRVASQAEGEPVQLHELGSPDTRVAKELVMETLIRELRLLGALRGSCRGLLEGDWAQHYANAANEVRRVRDEFRMSRTS